MINANIINNNNTEEYNNANSNCRKIISNVFNKKYTAYLILNTTAASLHVMSMAFVHPRWAHIEWWSRLEMGKNKEELKEKLRKNTESMK